MNDFKQDTSRMAKTITALKATMAKLERVGNGIYLTE